MKIEKVKVSQLPKVGDVQRFIALGVDRETNDSAYADMEQLRGNTGAKAWSTLHLPFSTPILMSPLS
jgi:hypothetical protein